MTKVTGLLLGYYESGKVIASGSASYPSNSSYSGAANLLQIGGLSGMKNLTLTIIASASCSPKNTADHSGSANADLTATCNYIVLN